MLFPLLAVLWHCTAATVNTAADCRWAEVRALGENYGVDIDRAMDPIPVAPAAENFIAQPFLQSCLHDPDGERVKRMRILTEKCKEPLKNLLHSPDTGSGTRLGSILISVRKEVPELLPLRKVGESDNQRLLRLTDNLGIPWDELNKAAKLPHSQYPPIGTVPATDDDLPPNLSTLSPSRLLPLMRTASLRTHAALALRQPGAARGCLEIQNRVTASYFDHPTLINALVGTSFLQMVLSQIHTGFLEQTWREEDIEWFAQWAGTVNLEKVMTDATGMECLYAIRYIKGLNMDPGFEDRMVRSFEKSMMPKDMLAETAMPFRQKWLAPFRGHSEELYRLAPPGVLTFVLASELEKTFNHYMFLLKKGGLHEYAWPAADNRVNTQIVSFAKLGANFAAQQSKAHLLHTACALHRWHAEHGDYPESLKELEPGLPASASLDVCSGKPLIYERASKDGYRLRSVGTDRTDDGGRPIADDGKGDLVWK